MILGVIIFVLVVIICGLVFKFVIYPKYTRRHHPDNGQVEQGQVELELQPLDPASAEQARITPNGDEVESTDDSPPDDEVESTKPKTLEDDDNDPRAGPSRVLEDVVVIGEGGSGDSDPSPRQPLREIIPSTPTSHIDECPQYATHGLNGDDSMDMEPATIGQCLRLDSTEDLERTGALPTHAASDSITGQQGTKPLRY